MLLLGEGDAGHLDLSEPAEIERKIAPAAADIENAQARLKVELGGDQPELVHLRLLEALAVVEEIRAGILHALIEKQPVEIVAEIVVVGDVSLRLANAVRLLEALQPARDAPQHLLQGIGAEREPVDREQREEVAERRVLEAHPPVHIGLARMQLRIEEELGIERAVARHHGDLGPRRPAKMCTPPSASTTFSVP